MVKERERIRVKEGIRYIEPQKMTNCNFINIVEWISQMV